MNITDIPLESRYGRDVHEGRRDGDTECWCPISEQWTTTAYAKCTSPDCGKFWSHEIQMESGWRLLGLDEVIQRGDECTETNEWAVSLVSSYGMEYTPRQQNENRTPMLHYRRRITEPMNTTPPELPDYYKPIATKDRLPTKEDANEEGYVLVFKQSWFAMEPGSINPRCHTHWMRQPPAPPAPKSEAQVLVDEFLASKETKWKPPILMELVEFVLNRNAKK